jgi:hypothetical protein
VRDWYDEAYYEDDGDDWVDDDEVPPELDEAYSDAEEAYATWQDAHKKMNELSRARGFYPVVALLPQGGMAPVGVQAQRTGSGKGKDKGRGRGKSKGGGGTGRSPPGTGMLVRRPPWRPPAAASSSPSASAAAAPESRSTGSGATAQHGPRFKRMRSGGMFKEAGSAEDGYAAEEVLTSGLEEEALTVEAGKGILDEALAFEDADQAGWDIEMADSDDSTEDSASSGDYDEGVGAYKPPRSHLEVLFWHLAA